MMQAYTADDYRALTSRAPTVDFGCDILDDTGQVIGDLTSDLLDCEVQHSSYADVHRTAIIRTTRELDWPRVWLRPWQSVTGDGATARFDVGVFRPAVPELPMGSLPLIYEVTCADKLSVLQSEIGDTRVSTAGARVLTEVQRAIFESGVFGSALTSSESVDSLLNRDLVWILSLQAPQTYLRWVNDLLSTIAYRAVHMSSQGDFVLEKYRSPSERLPEWTFDLTDPDTNIVEQQRSATTYGWTTTNWWRFVRKGMKSRPIEGNGIYTVDRSYGALQVREVIGVDAASQDSLVSYGDQKVERDQSAERTVAITVGPMPILGHFDLVTYIDPDLGGRALTCQMRSWHTNLATGKTDIVLETSSG